MSLDPMTSFGQGLKELIEKTLAEKSDLLNKQEIELAEREKLLEKIKENLKTKGKVTILVGNQLFNTNAEILLSSPNSFFHGLLNPEFYKDETLFIPRDPESFKYILEYLTYGELLSVEEVISKKSLLLKLSADADYYLLTGLSKQIQTFVKNKTSDSENEDSSILCSLHNATLGGSGYFWQWGSIRKISQSYFEQFTTKFNNDSVRIKVRGIYQIIIRTCCVSAANYYMSLYVNGTDVARSHSSSCSHYSHSFHINEILTLKENDYLQVYQTFSSSSSTGDPYNSWNIICLGNLN